MLQRLDIVKALIPFNVALKIVQFIRVLEWFFRW